MVHRLGFPVVKQSRSGPPKAGRLVAAHGEAVRRAGAPASFFMTRLCRVPAWLGRCPAGGLANAWGFQMGGL